MKHLLLLLVILVCTPTSALAYSDYDYVGHNLRRSEGVVNVGIMGGVDLYQNLGYHQPVIGFYAITPIYGNFTGGIWGLNSGTIGLSLGVNLR